MVALDIRTGAVIWEFQTVGDASAPVVDDGVVYVSVDGSYPEFSPRVCPNRPMAFLVSLN